MEIEETQLHVSHVAYQSNRLLLEGLIFKPSPQGVFSGVVYLHGHRSNCWGSAWVGYRLARAGLAVFIPSQVGYPFSEGARDFCGPQTMHGVLDGVNIFLAKDYINTRRVAVWGVSRGATAAALVAVRQPQLFRAAVFQSGVYELRAYYESAPEGIRGAISQETDMTEQAFAVRSPLRVMEKLECPALILHGRQDERISVKQAELLDNHLMQLNKQHTTIILEDEAHFLTKKTLEHITIPFLREYL